MFTNHKSQASQVEVGIRATNLTWFSNPSCNNVSCDSPNFSPWAIVLIVIVMVILILAGLGIYFYNLVIHLPIIFGPIVWDMMLHPTSVVKTPNVCDGHQSALVFYRHQYTTKAEHVRNFDPHHDKAATFLFQRKVNFWGDKSFWYSGNYPTSTFMRSQKKCSHSKCTCNLGVYIGRHHHFLGILCQFRDL